MQTQTEWTTGLDAWEQFVRKHPELGYKPSYTTFHNFLRVHRSRLKQADAIRLAKKKFWVAHVERFCETAFDCATGAFDLNHLLTNIPWPPQNQGLHRVGGES